MPPTFSPSSAPSPSSTPSSAPSPGTDLVLVYAATTVAEVESPPAAVPAHAEPVDGVGFRGWRWEVPAGGAGGGPEASLLSEAALSEGGLSDALLSDAVLPAGHAVAVVPAAFRAAEPKMLVMDVDSTLIRQEVIELLAAHAGREAEVAAVTEAAMRGELDFTQSLHHRVRALAGLEEAVIDDVVAAVEPQPGARELIAAFHAAGWPVCAVSGGFTQVLAPLAADLGLDHYRANDLEVVQGRLTGRVLGTVVDRAVKAEMLHRWSTAAGVGPEGVVAVGDGANDIDMLDAAGLAVAFCAKPALREHADVELDVPSLDVIRVLAGL
ncbi:phosphoserine phosphatase SerB [Citricoccus sp. NPDC055426]|uniref:phosphoserine phosphatase SerB n=1 Tax=Citricoccus sp. NPDC055426 TaxID=3155536 RepID=UPI00343179E9